MTSLFSRKIPLLSSASNIKALETDSCQWADAVLSKSRVVPHKATKRNPSPKRTDPPSGTWFGVLLAMGGKSLFDVV